MKKLKKKAKSKVLQVIPVEYRLVFGNMSCPGCMIIASLLITLERKMSFFGKVDIAEDFLLFNHILLLGKFYIYSRKYQNGIPSIQGLIARTRRVYNTELHIAGKRDKLNNHFRKWEKLISIFMNK